MIKQIEKGNDNIVAFEFTGEINREQFDAVVIPAVEKQIQKIDEINLVYILNTELSQFTAGAWFKDAMLGLENITKWNKAAIVTDNNLVQGFTDAFSIVMPGEFKGFDKEEIEQAFDWASK